MNVMRTFTQKSLRQNKKRTIVTIIGVIISAAMITAVSTFVASFLSMMQRDEIANGGNWHAVIEGVPVENLPVIENSGDVAATVRSQDLGFALLPDSQNEQRPYLFLREYSPDGYERMSIRLISGRLPQKSGEVVISETVANSAGVGYQVDDTLVLTVGQRVMSETGEAIRGDLSLQYSYDENGNKRTLNETFEETGTATVTVVGIMERPGFEYSWSAGCSVLGYLDESALSPTDAVDVYLTMSHVNRGIYDSVLALAEQAGKPGELTPTVQYNDSLLRCYGVVAGDNIIAFMYGFGAVITFIIIVASVSLIYNAFAISVSERAKQLGLLSSVGATKKQKRASIYYEAALIGAIGIPLGIICGIAGIGVTLMAIQPLLESMMNMTAGVTLTLVVSPVAIVIAMVLSAATIFISAYRPALRASRIMPIDAIRQTEDVKLTRKKVKTSKLTRALFGFEAEIALKNLKRNRKKYRATIVSLAISVVLFLTVSTYVNMMQDISGATYSGYNYDIGVTYANADQSAREDLSRRFAQLTHVTGRTDATEITGFALVSAEDLTDQAKKLHMQNEDGTCESTFTVVALDAASFNAFANETGIRPEDYADPNSPRAVLINHAQNYYNAGDGYVKMSGEIFADPDGKEITLLTGPSEGEKLMELTVGAVTQERPMGVLMQDFYRATLVVTQDTFDAMTSNYDEELQSGIHYATYFTTGDDQALEKQLTSIAKTSPADIYILNLQSAARAERNTGIILGVFIYGFIILISLICVANIFNTVSTNIALRRKEFAMLRSVGMTPKSFNRMIRFESVFYGLKALMYGLPISFAIGVILHYMQWLVLLSVFMIPWKSYAFAVLMILAIVFSTMLYATGKVKKENIVDALKEESF